MPKFVILNYKFFLNYCIVKQKLHIRLQSILGAHSSIYYWLINDQYDGLWFSLWEDPQNFWMNEAFLKVLEITSKSNEDNQDVYDEIANDECKKKVAQLLKNSAKKPGEFFNEVLNFQISRKEITMQVSGCAIKDEGFVLKFNSQNDKANRKSLPLTRKLAQLRKLEAVYKETNEIARIGGWDVDLVKNEITWTSVTCDIHEVPRDFIPNLNSGINFYKEGWSRDLIIKLFQEAVEHGHPFDEEFKLVTAKSNEIWVRSFGKPEFKNGKCIRVYGAFSGY